MDVLLFVLGVFGLVPIVTMGFFYTVIPVLLVGLQVLGVVEHLRDRRGSHAHQTRPNRSDLSRAA